MQNEPTNNKELNPNTRTNPNMEREQDKNSEIMAHLGALRCLSSLFRGGDHLRQSLAEALDSITHTIVDVQGAL